MNDAAVSEASGTPGPRDPVGRWVLLSAITHAALLGALWVGWQHVAPEPPPAPLIDPGTVIEVQMVTADVIRPPAPSPPSDTPPPQVEAQKPPEAAPAPRKPRPRRPPEPSPEPPSPTAPPPTTGPAGDGQGASAATPIAEPSLLPQLAQEPTADAEYALWFAAFRRRFTETFSVIDAFKGHGLITVVLVTFDDTGKVRGFSLTHSSGNAAVDQSVLLSASFVSVVPLPPERFRSPVMSLELRFDADDA